jgi:hypothetical protein
LRDLGHRSIATMLRMPAMILNETIVAGMVVLIRRRLSAGLSLLRTYTIRTRRIFFVGGL